MTTILLQEFLPMAEVAGGYSPGSGLVANLLLLSFYETSCSRSLYFVAEL